MGWTSTNKTTRQAVFAELVQEYKDNGVEVIDGQLSTNGWLIVKFPDNDKLSGENEPMILCVLINKEQGYGGGYYTKVMSECSYPYYYDVPVSWLTKYPTTNPNAKRWRDSVLAQV